MSRDGDRDRDDQRGCGIRQTGSGAVYRSFQGLPFAAPPVGPLRLAPPQPAAAWSEERKADGWVDIKCTQYGFISDGPAGHSAELKANSLSG